MIKTDDEFSCFCAVRRASRAQMGLRLQCNSLLRSSKTQLMLKLVVQLHPVTIFKAIPAFSLNSPEAEHI